jgi:hypothetical protein
MTSRDSVIFHGSRSHFDKASAIFDELTHFASVNSAILQVCFFMVRTAILINHQLFLTNTAILQV